VFRPGTQLRGADSDQAILIGHKLAVGKQDHLIPIPTFSEKPVRVRNKALPGGRQSGLALEQPPALKAPKLGLKQGDARIRGHLFNKSLFIMLKVPDDSPGG